MIRKALSTMTAATALLILAACQPQVYMQSVPVSTNPMGASVMADGKEVCQTPCSVELARNKDHIVTLVKDGYMQRDVPVVRQMQDDMYLKAMNRGINTGQFHNDPFMGINSGVQAMDNMKHTGEAYELAPSVISVDLVPKAGLPMEGGAAPASSSPGSALDHMRPFDYQQLSGVLEFSPSGTTQAWTNPETGCELLVTPEPGKVRPDNVVLRNFKVTLIQGDHSFSNRYPAYRNNAAKWFVGTPLAAAPQGAKAGKSQGDQLFWASMMAIGAAAGPAQTKVWSSKSSSKSSSISKNGTYKETRTSTSSSVSVGVDPAGAAKALHDLSQ